MFQTVGGGSSGGGGGGSLQWVEADIAPVPSIENNQQIYAFAGQLSEEQHLHCMVRVPQSYETGNQINLLVPWYSSGTSDTVKLQCTTTLIRTGTDAITSITNQHLSTNGSTTLDTPANEARSFTIDLTSATGQVNSVSVSAGDLLLVDLSRDNGDTSTSDANMLAYGSEVTFS